MEQPGGIPNMLLPPNDYIGPEERANYRIEAVQEMPFDPVPQKSGLYEAGFTGSLQRNPKHRQEAYIDFCPNQPVVAPNICQYDANAVPFATLDYHRRPPQAMVGGIMSHPELEDERRTLPRGRSGMHNPNFHGSRAVNEIKPLTMKFGEWSCNINVDEILTKTTLLYFEIVTFQNYISLRSAERVLKILQEVFF
ncbi:UNVERIFIED_CONTAM: hypothetical protein NCL1_36441 [Trichonephila clavipes]